MSNLDIGDKKMKLVCFEGGKDAFFYQLLFNWFKSVKAAQTDLAALQKIIFDISNMSDLTGWVAFPLRDCHRARHPPLLCCKRQK